MSGRNPTCSSIPERAERPDVRRTPCSGIIYASTRKRAQEIGDRIAEETKRRVVVYHAGLLPDQRRAAQEDFMTGRCEVVVATNAFGMGIDKSDVRFVVHYNIPGSLEAYYQEASGPRRPRREAVALPHAVSRVGSLHPESISSIAPIRTAGRFNLSTNFFASAKTVRSR